MIAEKYKDRYFINGESLFRCFGAIIERGGYAELLRQPQRKEQYSHSWLDQNGTDRFTGTNFYDSRLVTLSIVFVCESLADYVSNSTDFFELLKGGYVELASTTLGKEWQLLYDNTSSTEELNDIYRGGVAVVRHTINFVDDRLSTGDFDLPSYLLVTQNGIEYYLTDSEGNNFFTI